MAISESKILKALGQHLEGVVDVPTIAWENQHIDPERPFLAAEHIPVSRTDPTIDGTAETVTGQFRVTVVIKAGEFSTPASDLADAVRLRFKYMTLISFDDGAILIIKPPETLTGFKDGPDWRLPVRIDYEVQT